MSALRISYLGSPGSYSHQVASDVFPGAELVGQASFGDVVGACERGETDYAVMPVENSIAGRVPDVHRILLNIALFIRGEYILRIQHCLLGPAIADPSTNGRIERIYSHDQGFAQCSRFLARHFPAAQHVRTDDTASAVRLVAQAGEPTSAAIGSMASAVAYGARVIAENIADLGNNFTRFFILERPTDTPPASEPDITTLIFQTDHRPGALLDALTCFARADINVTKLETYPISDAQALPTFYIDVGAGLRDPRLEQALAALEGAARQIKLLGSYKASDQRSFSSGFLPTQLGSAR
jgi:prephenate dehydratase